MTNDKWKMNRAFTLIELLAAVALIAVFTLTATALFRSALRWSAAGTRAMADRRDMDQAVAQLRADVWSAYDVAVGDARTLVLRLADDRSIAWQVVGDSVRRTVWRDPSGIEQALPDARASEGDRREWPTRGGAWRLSRWWAG